MKREQLIGQIRSKNSYLCVGLDSELEKLPPSILAEKDPVFTFNKAIIDATRDLCVSYKINTAFYEAQGVKGWEDMQRTVEYIGHSHFRIADAKRGDIGNTSEQYVKAFFDTLPFDAVTVAPYMGEDSVRPFLGREGKWAIVLGLTSNKGAADFELKWMGEQRLYEKVLNKVSQWGTINNLMFVTGATQSSELVNIRNIIPDHFLLVPGLGAQGGSLEEISAKAMNKECGILVNASRAIIFASSATDFAEAARKEAMQYQKKMSEYLGQFAF